MLSKKQLRKENKKKKLAALAKVVELNTKERGTGLSTIMARDIETTNSTRKRKNQDETKSEPVDLKIVNEEGDNEGFSKVTYKKKRQNVQQQNNANNKDTKVGTFTITDEQYKELQKQLKQRVRELKVKPVLHLTEMGQRASISTESSVRTPLFLTDIQNLIMYMLMQRKSPCKPERWCYVEHPESVTHTFVLIVEGLSLYHYHAFESKFVNVKRIFEKQLELVLPPISEGSIIKELVQVPLTMSRAPELIEKHGSLDIAVEMTKDPLQHVKTMFAIEKETEEENYNVKDLHENDKFPRTKLLLSALQMVDNGFPVPLRGELGARFQDYVFTKDKYAPVTNKSPMFGVDCEMCFTSAGRMELTRISIVNENMETIYETLVRPSTTIVDYLTQYSGITEEIMLTATKTLDMVQNDIRKLLPDDAILVGQSLESDLNAMMMMHPYVIDTSVCFNLTGVRRHKSKLKVLSETFLKEYIQLNALGHDSVEDSQATLKLVQLKLAHSVDFGDEILLRKKRFQEIITSANDVINNKPPHPFKGDRNVSIITDEKCLPKKLKSKLEKANKPAKEENKSDSSEKPPQIHLHEFSTNKQIMKKAREVALDHALILSNISVDMKDSAPEIIEEKIEKVDKWINRAWRAVAPNGMFIVVLGGSMECPSGLAQIAIKKCQSDSPADEASGSDKEE